MDSLQHTHKCSAPPIQPNRITLDVPPNTRIIIPIIVVTQARFTVTILAWEAHQQRDAVGNFFMDFAKRRGFQ